MSEFGEKLRNARIRTRFQSICRLPQMTREDHVSGEYSCIFSKELWTSAWELSASEDLVDYDIRHDLRIAYQISQAALKQNADRWDFGTIDGLIACTHGNFTVNYYAFKRFAEETPNKTDLCGKKGTPPYGKHPFIKQGPFPSGPEKKY